MLHFVVAQVRISFDFLIQDLLCNIHHHNFHSVEADDVALSSDKKIMVPVCCDLCTQNMLISCML